MVALTSERNTKTRLGDLRYDAVAAAVKIFAGSIVMRNAAGLLTKGATATGCFGVGRAESTVDNSAGAAGALSLTFRTGQFCFANLAADLITQADVGKVCFIADDQTVAKTSGGGTRSPAGIVEGLEVSGAVWVRFDEALTRAS
jgi:hypothetical protein